MQKALDLRVLIKQMQTAVAVEQQLSALRQLWHWARTSGKVDLPDDFEDMKKQHIAVSAALSGAMAEANSQFKARWEGEDKKAQRCAPIMKDLLTNPRFYQGNEAWCFLFCHCALKMPPESVVESMGKTVADHGDIKRGNIDIETYTEEAVIHWNGPPPTQAKGICIAALKAVFGARWKTAFEHGDDRDYRAGRGKGQKRKAVFVSATVARLRRQKPKLAFLADGA
jgi:post-segregation antitoxin (ccd killing protein)